MTAGTTEATGASGATGTTGTASLEAEGLSLRERQRRRAHADLVRATTEVIAHQGLERATIERITRRAGTSRATLYAHFPGGRTELIEATYRAIGREVLANAERDAASQPADDWIEQVTAYQRAMVRLAERRELSVFYNIDGPHLFALGRRRGSGSQRTLDAFVRILTTAQGEGRVVEGIDIPGISALLVGAMRETGIDATREPGSTDAHTRAFRQLLEALSTPA
ncbi:MAG: TetR/AcrR family transcriptional regulator [Pseudoclavibacter sp.]